MAGRYADGHVEPDAGCGGILRRGLQEARRRGRAPTTAMEGDVLNWRSGMHEPSRHHLVSVSRVKDEFSCTGTADWTISICQGVELRVDHIEPEPIVSEHDESEAATATVPCV